MTFRPASRAPIPNLMPDLGATSWFLILAITLAASLGTLHIICKRLATDKEIARMVRDARALRLHQEQRLAEMRSGRPRVEEAPFMEVGAPEDLEAAESDVIIVDEAEPIAQAA